MKISHEFLVCDNCQIGESDIFKLLCENYNIFAPNKGSEGISFQLKDQRVTRQGAKVYMQRVSRIVPNYSPSFTSDSGWQTVDFGDVCPKCAEELGMEQQLREEQAAEVQNGALSKILEKQVTENPDENDPT